MAAFFDKGNPAGEPEFRSKRGRQGFVVRDAKARRLSRHWGEVQVPKCGRVRFRWTKPLPASPGMARITLDRAGKWHVSFPAPQPTVSREPAGKAIGVDLGVRTARGSPCARPGHGAYACVSPRQAAAGTTRSAA